MSPESSCAEGLVIPNAAEFRGGAFGKCFDHEGSDFMDLLIYLWTHNSMG
jgi:hypothetical protein